MIRLIEALGERSRRLCLNDPSGVRLLCVHRAYAGCSFALFWEQTLGPRGGEPTALLCLLDGCYTLTGTAAADYAELAAFLSALGAEEVFCTAETGQALGWKARKKGLSLCLRGKSTGRMLPPGVHADWSPSPGRVYETLSACRSDAIELPERTAFHADLSHRLRHRGGRCLLLERGGEALACAVAAETDEAAYISGLAVLPGEQGRGLGAAALDLLCCRLLQEGKMVWALSEKRTAGFYGKLGFAPTGEAGWYRAR